MTKSYAQQVQEQIEQYRDTEEMHALPAVFHDWSGAAILPGMGQVFGAATVIDLFAEAFVTAAAGAPSPCFLSLGCGDGSTEIEVAQNLVGRGMTGFRFVCCDLSPILLDRFRAAIPPQLADRFELVAGDLNDSSFDRPFDAVMANHSLHHMVELEDIFAMVYRALRPGGIFVTNDMIGRNGHMRWDEAKLFVEFFWPFMTLRQRRNVQLRRVEERFINHDCSNEGFEGIRAQDVLPCILGAGFHAWKFMGFGGLIDIFVDRCFGPNFDVTDPDDLFLARRMAFLNDVLLDCGAITPTMMLAWFTKDARPDATSFRGRTAQAAVRTGDSPAWLGKALQDFQRCETEPGYVFRNAPDVAAAPASASAPAPVPAPALAPPAVNPALAVLQAELQVARADAATAQLKVRALEESTSWQMTGPFRAVKRMLQR